MGKQICYVSFELHQRIKIMVTRVVCPKTYKLLLIGKILAGEGPYRAVEEGTEIIIPTTAGGVAIKVSPSQWRSLLESMGNDLIRELGAEESKMKNPPLDISIVIQQRDNAEEAFSQVYHLVFGEFPNFSKNYADLVNEIELKLKESK
jgi:hypothetical protein